MFRLSPEHERDRQNTGKSPATSAHALPDVTTQFRALKVRMRKPALPSEALFFSSTKDIF